MYRLYAIISIVMLIYLMLACIVVNSKTNIITKRATMLNEIIEGSLPIR